jgi:hypothetical protein
MVINSLIDSSLWLVFCILLNVQVFRQSDGPAIKGDCGTRRSIRAGSWYFSSASWLITVQGTPSLKLRSPKEGMARVFAVMVQDLNCVQMRALPTEAERRWVSGYNGITNLSW